jgi:hypothetical protein
VNRVEGDLWTWHEKGYVLLIPTNGMLKRDGSLVMGAGLALDCANRYPWVSAMLGRLVRSGGNKVFYLGEGLVSFPTKEHWREPSTPARLAASAVQFAGLWQVYRWQQIALPEVGCGLGGMKWPEAENSLRPLLSLQAEIVVVSRNLEPKRNQSGGIQR